MPHTAHQTQFTKTGERDMRDHRNLRSGQRKQEAKNRCKVGDDGAYHFPPQEKK